jgi:beta-glucosidase
MTEKEAAGSTTTAATPFATPFDGAVAAVRSGTAPAVAAAELLARLEPAERLGLLDGDEPFWPGMRRMMGEGYNLEPIVAGAVPRLGVPGVRFADGPRGAVVGRSTAFPVPMARGATWDPDLEERVGAAIGAEIRAQGGNFFGGVCVNLLRHPAWGRAQETYGEEPVLLGAMGAALSRGAQRHVMACVKHYACNSMENARFTVDVRVDEHTLHEVYLPHFREVVRSGVAAVMSAYNSVNGEWCGQNRVLLTEILRDEWGFAGFTVSDFVWGLRDPARSLAAGLDVEMPFAQQRAAALPAALAAGEASWADVDRAAGRILATQLRFAAAVAPDPPGRDVVASPAHRDLAREVAARAMVLLRNESVEDVGGDRPALPLAADGLDHLLVAGRLADLANTGDHGSSDVRAPDVVTALAGLRAALPGVRVTHVADDPAAAAAAAREAGAAVVVVGYTAADEGEYVGSFDPALAALYPPADDPDAHADLARVWAEGPQAVGGDRASLRLHGDDVAMIRAVAAANPRTVVVVVAGAAVVMTEWADEAAGPAAVLLAWYAGMAGGAALADVLLGRAEPGGRLPFAVPRDEADLPPFDRDATSAGYDAWHGQRRLDRDGVPAAYPFGFGLSYSRFELTGADVERDGEMLRVDAGVRNAGDRDGSHVVQLYAVRPADGHPGVARRLVGFARVDVPAGAERRVRIDAPLVRLARREGPGRWVVPGGQYRLEVASHAADPSAVVLPLVMPSDLPFLQV